MSWSSSVSRTVLSNGLTVLVQRDESAAVVAVVTHVRAGYFDEPDDWVGISHVLEHMFFKGTARRKPGDIARETQAVGGYVNAGTIYDKTVYYTVMPSTADGLARALDIQADALCNSALDAAELSRELEVIIEEAKRKRDNPPAVAYETMLGLLYREHRVRRWRIGTEEGLRRLTTADVRRYYETRYTPERVIVAVVGNVDPDAVGGLVERYYGSWDRPPGEVDDSPAERGHVIPRMRLLRGDIERPIATIGWRTVPALHRHEPALDVAAALLAHGRGSHFYRSLRLPGLASAVSADHYVPTEIGTFSVALEAEPASFDRALEVVLGRVVALCDGVDDRDLERVRALLTTQWLRRLESMEGRASAFCEAEALGNVALLDQALDKRLSVRAQEVADVAEEYLRPELSCGVLYVPDRNHTQRSAWPPRPDEAGRIEAVAARDRFAVTGAVPDDVLQEVTDTMSLAALPSADVLLYRKPHTGLVTLGFHWNGIPKLESRVTAGISWLLARSALRGAGGMSGEELATLIERLGASIGTSLRADSLGWWLTAPSDRVDGAAAILSAVVGTPHLDVKQVETEAGLLASDARRIRDDMFRFPTEAVRALAFPGHPYGLPSCGFPDAVGNLDAEAVRGWYGGARTVRPLITAVGDIHPQRCLEALAPLFDGPAKAAAQVGPSPPAFVEGRDAEERQKQQSALALAFPGVRHASPDRYAVVVMCSILSGLAGRLFDELREKRSLAYTVVAMPWLARDAGSVITYVATSPDREDEAHKAMLAELSRLSRDPPDGDELDRARQYAAGSVEVRRQHGSAIAEDLVSAWVKGTFEEVSLVPERLRTVTCEDVMRVAEMVFGTGRHAEFVVRGSGVVASGSP